MALRKIKILGIAINEYDDKRLGNLDNPEKDINDIIQVLTSKYYYEDVDFLFGKEKTTRKFLYSLVRDYLINAIDGDSLLIVFAGHGIFDESFGTTYWQPSDADENDPSSWFNLNDLLAFMRNSKANHISIISDSCFAGGIFENKMRGGGIQAFDNKISREALTSGGLEKVSDGKKAENSPFVKDVIKILSENNDRHFPFISLSQKLILEFEKVRQQTPQYGSLNNVGHNGGSLILELKEEASDRGEKNSLELLLGNLYVSFVSYSESNIEDLKVIWGQKNKLVRAQRYEEAAKIRDTEKLILEDILVNFEYALKAMREGIKLEGVDEKKINDLNVAIESHLKKVNDEKEEYEQTALSELEEKTNAPAKKLAITRSLISTEPTIRQHLLLHLNTDLDNPASKYFTELRNELLANYKKSVMDLYSCFITKTAKIKSDFIENKHTKLVEILKDVHSFQISYLTSDGMSELRKELKLSEVNYNFLKWIDNTES